MRIRQIRPEFFADGRVSKLSVAARLTYIGLWCIADDDGWLVWNAEDIAAQLYPYESIRVRTRRLEAAGEALVGAGRMVIHPCGCARIKTVPVHQRIGGTKSYTARDRHLSHPKSIHIWTNPPVGSEVVSEVVNRASAQDDDGESETDFRARVGVPAFMGGSR